MKRFLRTVPAVFAFALLLCCQQVRGGAAAPSGKPNILVIVTDQQHAGMMSCAGNRYLKTPAMDWLAEHGVRFERAYAANPVCVPSRFSLQSGCYPSVIGMRHNGDSKRTRPFPGLKTDTLGWRMHAAGYDVVYGGKVHLPVGAGMGRIEELGYRMLVRDTRDVLAQTCADFIREKRDKPFFLFASFINPHDICYMAIQDHAGSKGKGPAQQALKEALRLPESVAEAEFFAKHCPPVPPNYEPTEGEPKAMEPYLKQRPFKWHARTAWTDEKWRLHRWAYARLTERVDAEIGRVLEALRESGQAENTLVVLTSDHGDMDGAHRTEHKTLFYEEAIRVPFVVAWKGVTKAGAVDDAHFVVNGLDLLPTLCDYAGIDAPAGLLGRSVRPLAEGRAAGDWREELVVESELGRLLRVGPLKYWALDFAGPEEVLIDLEKDPGEMKNLAGDPAHRGRLEEMRRRLEAWQKRTGISYSP